MISKCANPDCEISFDEWRGLFRFPKNHPGEQSLQTRILCSTSSYATVVSESTHSKADAKAA
jgi:hypothetical protein